MADASLGTVLRHVRLLAAGGTHGPSDSDLLQAFLSHRDESAFAALVRRHGPMVLSVCRRVLHHQQDAEDAFQATFLVLARKAASVRTSAALAGWLHGAAYRMALGARRAAARRRTHEGRANQLMGANDPLTDLSWREVQTLLDAEVQKLPEKYRAVFVLCCLEGESRTDTARALGLKEGTVSSRLNEARKRLQHRLARRGVALATVLGATALTRPASAVGLPAGLVGATARAATMSAAVSAPVAALVETGVRTISRMPRTMPLLLTLGLIAGGAGLIACQAPAEPPPEPAARRVEAAQPAEAARKDHHGDPLPPGAVLRLGTVRLRHGSTVTGVAFLPDGKRIVSCSYDKTVRLWDPETGQELKRLPPMRGSAYALCLAADGRTIAATDGQVYFGDLEAGQLAPTRSMPGGVCTCIGLSPDGKTLATASMGSSTVQLWDTATWRQLQECQGHTAEVKRVRFAPDGKALATASTDGSVRLWEVSGKEVLRLDPKEATQALAFSADGRLLATGGADQKLYLWELPTGKLLRAVGAECHYPTVETIAFAPDGKTVGAAGSGSPIYHWDVATGKELHRMWGYAQSIAFAPDGRTLVSGGHHCSMRVWDMTTGKERTNGAAGHQGAIHRLAVSRDGRLAATGGGDRDFRLWDLTTGQELRRFQVMSAYGPIMALAPDGKLLASDNCFWDTSTGQLLGKIKDQDYGIDAIVFAPDGRTVAMATTDAEHSHDRAIRLWNVATAAEVKHFGTQPVQVIAYSPDGKMLAAGNRNGTISLWEVATGREIYKVPGHQRELDGIAFAPDGKLLATSSFDGDLFLWDAATGKQLRRLVYPGRRGPQPIALAFSPDSRMLATAEQPFTSEAGTSITLWEVATGQARQALKGHEGNVNVVAFAGNARTLVSCSTDTTALVWDLPAALRPAPPRVEDLSAAQRETLWADLLNDEAPRAYRAICTLTTSPGGARFLGQHLAPAAAPNAEQVARLARRLDSDDFSERAQAGRELEKLGETAEPVLRKAIEASASPEVRRRLEQQVERLSVEWLRTRRAVEALELAATPEAGELLRALAKGAPESRQSQEAQAALDRRLGGTR